jgi:hypothetical protein
VDFDTWLHVRTYSHGKMLMKELSSFKLRVAIEKIGLLSQGLECRKRS